ncbi:MAG: carbohydrate binding domain-containing protein [Porphyromonas sp.]|nr:carbohydrate binding domain-containing protein [Porphyromonas sp.]
MNKTFRRLLACALVALPLGSVWGQANLIKNPSFEEEYYGRPKHWRIDSYLSGERVSGEGNVHSGQYALAIYQTGATFSPGEHHPTEGFMDIQGIQPNTKYTFSFWVKGDNASYTRTLRPISFTWRGNGDSKTTQPEFAAYPGVKVTTEWQQVKFTIVSPANAATLALTINVPSGGSDAPRLFLDDFSLTAEAPKVSAPAAPTATAHQRELEINWTAVSGASYDLEVNGQTYTSTTGKQLVAGLKPNTEYSVKLRVTQGGSTSDWTTTTIRTLALTTSQDEEGRTPYLRTIKSDGRCSTTLALYYNELHSDTASFTYFVDGQSVRPNNDNTLTLTQGEHVLQVEVKESEDRVYILTYNLIVN